MHRTLTNLQKQHISSHAIKFATSNFRDWGSRGEQLELGSNLEKKITTTNFLTLNQIEFECKVGIAKAYSS
jgi:hypothetical protein